MGWLKNEPPATVQVDRVLTSAVLIQGVALAWKGIQIEQTCCGTHVVQPLTQLLCVGCSPFLLRQFVCVALISQLFCLEGDVQLGPGRLCNPMGYTWLPK